LPRLEMEADGRCGRRRSLPAGSTGPGWRERRVTGRHGVRGIGGPRFADSGRESAEAAFRHGQVERCPPEGVAHAPDGHGRPTPWTTARHTFEHFRYAAKRQLRVARSGPPEC
jgi:hypothetical protein